MSLYNLDELIAPEWINEEFCEKVLKHSEKTNNLKVTSLDVSPASLKGDHIACILFRCKVKFCLAGNTDVLEKSFIVKTLPASGSKREYLMNSNVFETEMQMYTETLPYMEKILADHGEPTKLSALIYYNSLHPHTVLVFEDLCATGYEMVRGRYLTQDEVKAVYTKLAKLHAVSYMLGQSDQHISVTKYQTGTFAVRSAFLENLLQNGLRNFTDLLTEISDLHVYRDKIKAVKDSILEGCIELYNAYRLNQGKGDIFVLNHGDFHMKNLMFKYDANNQMQDTIMVDYQRCCYAPSTVDIGYSHYMILSPELRMKRHELTQFYFSEFLRILKKINCPGKLPEYSELEAANLKYRYFVIFFVSTYLPLVTALLLKPLDELREMDAENIFGMTDFIRRAYSDPRYIEDLRNVLPILLNEGFLEK